MPLFTKPSPALVYDLINEANPDLPVALTTANAKLDNPTTATVSGRPELNTAINVISIGGDYIGRKALNYRRLALDKLLRGITVQMNKYSANQGAAGSVVFTVYNLLPLINSKYGLNLTTDDVADVNILRGNTQENGYYTTTVTVTAKPTSLGYVGSFGLKWKSAPQELESMITVTSLNARKFPAGNDFVTPGHATIVNNMAYGIDWSSFITSGVHWDNYPNSIEGAGTNIVAWGSRFIDELNRLYGKNLQKPYNAAPAYAYQGWAGRVVDLSTQAGRDSAPLANYKYYNRVLIWTIPDSDTQAGCGAGQHYIHYNV